MKDLIEALTIFSKYTDAYAPTCCLHDIMLVVGIGQGVPTADERARLEALGWHWNEEFDAWGSFRFGSA